MAIDFQLVESAKMQTTACGGDYAVWILHSRLHEPEWEPDTLGYCILVQPKDKLSSQVELDRLTAGVPTRECQFTLEQWLAQLSDDEKKGDFYFCLDLPSFSKKRFTQMNVLLEEIHRSVPKRTPRIYGISPDLRNWKTLLLNGFVQSASNSHHAGVHFFKFVVGFVSPRADSCIDTMEFEEFLFEPDNAAILIQGKWFEGAEPRLEVRPDELEFIQKSYAIVVVSAGTPLTIRSCRLLRPHLESVATSAEFVYAMNHRGVVCEPDGSAVVEDIDIHILCRLVQSEFPKTALNKPTLSGPRRWITWFCRRFGLSLGSNPKQE